MFAIDIAAFAVMSNHLHVVLRIDAEKANAWSDKEIIERWHQIFKGDDLTHQFLKDKQLEAHQMAQLKHLIATYRSRLWDISCPFIQKRCVV